MVFLAGNGAFDALFSEGYLLKRCPEERKKERMITMKTLQLLLTVSMGKRLIACGLMADQAVRESMTSGRLLIVAGTTDARVAQEALRVVGSNVDLDPRFFRRGLTSAPGTKADGGQTSFDLLIDHGTARTDRTVFDVAPELTGDDIILKGANAVYLPGKEAGVLIGHPQGGTMMPILSAALGRRVQIIVPVGLEKRVDRPIRELVRIANNPEAEGCRMCPIPGRVFTELDAIRTLTGASAELLAAGGVLGAEGAVYLAVTGNEDQLEAVRALYRALRDEPPASL